MQALPSGTVTLLFSDIEGSTAVLSRLGTRWGEALSAHRALMREAFQRWDGHEMGVEGDSFFVAFHSAGSALRAAIDCQRALDAHDWPDSMPVRARIGLHTGEPTLLDDGYIGLDVHLGARVAGTAHGGQVVLSEATCRLVTGDLPDGVHVRDLGLHRLKDLPEPVEIHELQIPDLPGGFPPLRSLGAVTNLPRPSTPLVDRVAPLGRLQELLRGSSARLVTVTGPGGSGKTRIAVAAANATETSFRNGTFFVELGAADTAREMWSTLADVVGAAGDGQPRERALSVLTEMQSLLVLDNLEQLTGAAEEIAALLAAAPEVTVLATSRRALRMQGEHVLSVPALALPEDPADVDAVRASDAVQLFVQHARMVRPDFVLTDENARDVAAICARLDGLPLAIEIAAARVKLLGPAALLRRLDDRLGLTDRALRPSRQRTLRDTIAWSYDLLAPDLQAVFRRLGAFSGGCDLEALEAVAAGGSDPFDVVEELHDVSLVWVREGTDGEPRVGLLETVREFALERLTAAAELDDVRRRHAEYFRQLAQRTTPEGSDAYLTAVLDKLDGEQENFRAALSWCFGGPAGGAPDTGRLALGLRLTDALTTFWYRRGYVAEARHWFQLAVDSATGGEGADVADAVHGLGVFLQQQGEDRGARELFERALAMWEMLDVPARVSRELNSLGIAYRNLGATDAARAALRRSLDVALAHGLRDRLPAPLTNLALLEIDHGQVDVALERLRQALAVDIELGDVWGTTVDRTNVGAALLRAGLVGEAAGYLFGAVDEALALGDVDLFVNVVELIGALVAEQGDPLCAARLTAAADRIRRDVGIPLADVEWGFLERFLGPARAVVPRAEWDAAWDAGRHLPREDLLALLRDRP